MNPRRGRREKDPRTSRIGSGAWGFHGGTLHIVHPKHKRHRVARRVQTGCEIACGKYPREESRTAYRERGESTHRSEPPQDIDPQLLGAVDVRAIAAAGAIAPSTTQLDELP